MEFFQVTDFFSYEHFYVIYCKFWELDKDHDLFIDREDLARHNDHGWNRTLQKTNSDLFCFSFEHAHDRADLLWRGDTRQCAEGGEDVVHRVRLVPSQRGGGNFILFIVRNLCHRLKTFNQDKRHPTAIEYWFRCMDLDGDGLLSM